MYNGERTDYTEAYAKFESAIEEKEDSSPCEKLDEMRKFLVDLDQKRNTYFRRPCLRDWPCFFTQHRSEIDKMKERLTPVEKRLTRECKMSMHKKLIGDIPPGSTSSSSASAHIGDDIHNHIAFKTPKP